MKRLSPIWNHWLRREAAKFTHAVRLWAACLALVATGAVGGEAAGQGAAGGAPSIVFGPDEGLEARELFQVRCAACHDQPQGRTPSRRALGEMSAERIYTALSSGIMREQGEAIGERGRRLMAASLPARPPVPEPDLAANQCGTAIAVAARGAPDAGWGGFGLDSQNTRFQAKPGLAAGDVPRLKLKWAFAYPGGSVSGLPVILEGRLYTVSVSGTVIALDAATGCTLWTNKVGAGVRGAPSVGRLTAAKESASAVFVLDGRGTVTALDAVSGRPLWSTDIKQGEPGGASGSPVLQDGVVYAPFGAAGEGARDGECCRYSGGLAALEAATGRLLWRSTAIAEPGRLTRRNSAGALQYGPGGASIWSAPTVDPDRGLVYVGTGNDYSWPGSDASDAIVAFDLKTGARKWVSQVRERDVWQVGCDRDPHANCPPELGPDTDFSMPPILRKLPGGRSVLVAGNKGGTVYAFDPDRQGRILWQTRLTIGGASGGLMFGAAADRDTVYVPIGYGRYADQETKEAPTGGLAALRLATGKPAWRAPPILAPCGWGTHFCLPAQAAAVSAMPGVVFSGSADGHLRAYATATGKVVWEFDTGRSFEAVNGVTAQGGSIGRTGQTIAGGMLYLNAGGGYGGGGTALRAFSVDGK